MSEYHKWWSPALSRDMELKVYGRGGKPVLVFPSGGGRFFEYEDFGMVEACRPFLEAGRIQLVAVDSVDQESWFDHGAPVAQRARRHEQYERYVLEEVLPFIRDRAGMQGIMTTGCSGGGYHAANFLLRHPDVFDSVISLSGLYGQWFALKDQWDEAAYLHFPLAYLPNLEEGRQLELIRRAKIALCVGLGAWERCADYDCVGDARALERVLREKSIPAWVDYWGEDVNHDWEWWRRQMPYFLERML